ASPWSLNDLSCAMCDVLGRDCQDATLVINLKNFHFLSFIGPKIHALVRSFAMLPCGNLQHNSLSVWRTTRTPAFSFAIWVESHRMGQHVDPSAMALHHQQRWNSGSNSVMECLETIRTINLLGVSNPRMDS